MTPFPRISVCTGALKRSVTALALIGVLSAVPVGVSSVHAAGPQISVAVQSDNSLVVTGSGFRPGEQVVVSLWNGNASYYFILSWDLPTTATLNQPLCNLMTKTCHGYRLGGQITMVTPPIPVAEVCLSNPYVTVIASDAANNPPSNPVIVQVAADPSC